MSVLPQPRSSWIVEPGSVRSMLNELTPRAPRARLSTPTLDARRAREAKAKRAWRAANAERNRVLDREAHARARARRRAA